MVSPINTSLSGLQVAAKRIAVASENLANQQSTGSNINGKTVNTPYLPKEVVQISNNGFVTASVQTKDNPTQKLYQPDSPQADEYGFVNSPNVDQAEELVNLKIASYDYKANLKAIQVQNNVEQALLDIFS